MTPSIKANCVTYTVDDKVLISGLELELHPGYMLAVVGPNGAGKSTLCGVLGGDLTPMEGGVQVCGHDVRETKPATLARLRSMLTQQTQIRFPFTAREVVMMGRHPHIRRWRSPTETDFEAVEHAMKSVQVMHLADRVYPTLSGGEQRAGLPRARPGPRRTGDPVGRTHQRPRHCPSAACHVAMQAACGRRESHSGSAPRFESGRRLCGPGDGHLRRQGCRYR